MGTRVKGSTEPRIRLRGRGMTASCRTYRCVPLLADNEGAFNNGGARVVDAVQHGLAWQSVSRRANHRDEQGQTEGVKHLAFN